LQTSSFKGFQTLRAGLEWLGRQNFPQPVIFIGLGGDPGNEQIGHVDARFLPFRRDAPVVDYYQAADLYIHPARAETFPLVIAEALACGTPVVATAVGGVPEMIKGLHEAGDGGSEGPHSALNHFAADAATGLLSPPGDGIAFGKAIALLLGDSALRRQLAGNAARDAARRFDVEDQVGAYLDWYREILSDVVERMPERTTLPGF
jgi:glycosyltransferase involved in cell wall biosynthesis